MNFLELFSIVLAGSMACLVGSVPAALTGHGLLEVGTSGQWRGIVVGLAILICFCMFVFVLRFIHIHVKNIGPAFTTFLGSIVDVMQLQLGGSLVRYSLHVAFHLVWKATVNSDEPSSVLISCICILALISLWVIYARKGDVPSFISFVSHQLGLSFGDYIVTGKIMCAAFVLIPWFLALATVEIGVDNLGELYVVPPAVDDHGPDQLVD